MTNKEKFPISNFTDFINFFAIKNSSALFYMSEIKKNQITYKKLLRIIKNFSKLIKKYNIQTQDRVMVVSDNGQDLVLIYLSILYHKLIYVPVNPNIAKSEFNFLKKKTKPNLIITNKLISKKLKIKKNLFLIDRYKQIKNLKLVSKENQNISFSNSVNKDFVAQILFTSGSTGNPKGVVLTHQSMLHNLYGIFKSIKFNHKNLNFLSVTPLYHNNGQFIPTLLPFVVCGKTYSISPETSLINFWSTCKRLKINYCSVMATHINYFNTLKDDKNHKLEILFCGGAKLDSKSQIKFEKKFNIKVLCNYGLTETSSIACTESNINNSYKYGSVGKPLINNDIKVVKKNKQEFGEILIKGKNIFKEYLEDKETTEKVKKNKWLHTGDLGYFDKKGFLFIKDRIDNMIVVSGENIYPSEIENVIYEFKKIRLGIVTSVSDKITQNKLILIYESKFKIDKLEIAKFLSKKLTKYKIPKIILSCSDIGIREIPKAANKKILRKKIKLIVSRLFK
jgi:long-chain acyl-CoA synthetase